MKIEISYRASARNANKSEPVSEVALEEIGKLEHLNANISGYFSHSPIGISVSGGGVKFGYDCHTNLLTTIAIYETSAKPTEKQLKIIISESNAQIDLGFYGEDGWFVDIGEESYYIELWDKSVQKQPISIRVNGKNV